MSDAEAEHTEALVSDAEVIRQVRGGDTSAYATLYERHARAARSLARQLSRGEAEAQDAVAEAFTRVLSVIQRGKGPECGFRPYLLTAVRNAAYDRGRGEKRQVLTDDVESLDPGQPFVDPVLEGLERSLVARAFLSLPERWQTVLWHTEIEGVRPAEAAPILGMKPNGVAALAYRAREGLRQAYLQMHLAGGSAAKACRPALGLLGAYVRGGLSKRDTAKVDGHMDTCADCREVYAELMDVNVALRGVVLPLVVGAGAAGYLASVPGGAAVSASVSGGAAVSGWWRGMPRRWQRATAGSATAAGVAVSVALALIGGQHPLPEEQPPPAAAPQTWPEPLAGEPAADGPAADRPAAGEPLSVPLSNDPWPIPQTVSGASGVPESEEVPGASESSRHPEQAMVDIPPVEVPEEIPEEEASAPLLAVDVGTVCVLLLGSDGVVLLDVHDLGDYGPEDVVALITLPPGIGTTVSDGAGNTVPLVPGHGGWSCPTGNVLVLRAGQEREPRCHRRWSDRCSVPRDPRAVPDTGPDTRTDTDLERTPYELERTPYELERTPYELEPVDTAEEVNPEDDVTEVGEESEGMPDGTEDVPDNDVHTESGESDQEGVQGDGSEPAPAPEVERGAQGGPRAGDGSDRDHTPATATG